MAEAAHSQTDAAGLRDSPRSFRAFFGLFVVVMALALVLTGCSGGVNNDPDAPVMTVQVKTVDMRFEPDVIEVPVGTRLVVELTNTDQTQLHDLIFANGAGGTRLGPNATESINVGVIDDNLDGWCSIAGHREQGMVLTVVAVDADSAAA